MLVHLQSACELTTFTLLCDAHLQQYACILAASTCMLLDNTPTALNNLVLDLQVPCGGSQRGGTCSQMHCRL